MRVGLITFHNALNYGASLQAYATQRYINELGQKCTIIDYVNENRTKAYDMRAQIINQIKAKNFKMFLRMLIGNIFLELRRRNFSKFYEENLIKTNKTYHTSDEARELNSCFDYFVVGSDQVWNPSHNGSDPAFLLDFVEDKSKTISYASSFGLNEIPKDISGLYQKNLSVIQHLSTREAIGVKLIKDLTGRDAKLVLDPVFLLDRNQWCNLCKKEKAEKGKFIFVYTNRNNQFEEMVKTSGLDIKEYRIHKINRFLKPRDFINSKIKVDYWISPEKFVSNILNAQLVATASFHCVVMSIILHKKFIAFLTGDEGKDERITNILNITGLSNRIYRESMTVEDINSEIDYTSVEERLSSHLKESREFLAKAFL